MAELRWGVLSVSAHYRLRVHDQLESSRQSRVMGIASRDRAKAEAEAARLGIPKAYGSYDELLRDPDIDAVYIPLPNDMHAEWVRKAADAGKHALCEKPFAMDAKEAARAIEYASSKGVTVMEAFMYRFHPQWIEARRIIARGEIGALRYVHAQFSYMNKDPRNIRNIASAGGGAIMDIGCYAVSCARFLIGAEPVRVVSRIVRDPEFGTDSLSSGLLDFGTANAVFTVSTQSFPAQRVDAVGTSGSLSVLLPFNMYPDVPAEVLVRTSIGERRLACGPSAQYREMFDAFSARALEGKPAPIPPEDAIANMKVLDALVASERSGGWEPVL